MQSLQLFGLVVEIIAVALVGILLDRFLGTAVAVIGLCGCLVFLGWLHWDQIKPLIKTKSPIAQVVPTESPKPSIAPTAPTTEAPKVERKSQPKQPTSLPSPKRKPTPDQTEKPGTEEVLAPTNSSVDITVQKAATQTVTAEVTHPPQPFGDCKYPLEQQDIVWGDSIQVTGPHMGLLRARKLTVRTEGANGLHFAKLSGVMLEFAGPPDQTPQIIADGSCFNGSGCTSYLCVSKDPYAHTGTECLQ